MPGATTSPRRRRSCRRPRAPTSSSPRAAPTAGGRSCAACNLEEVLGTGPGRAAVDGDRLTTPHLLDFLKKSEEINRRHWEIHFILMYPADTIYLEFEAFCKQYGSQGKDFVGMLKGFTSMPAQTDEELWNLAKMAEATGRRDTFLNPPAECV